MSNALRKLLRRAKDFLGKRGQPLPGRTFVRKQGCWNCKHFCHEGPLFEQAKISTGLRDVRVMLEQSKTVHQAAVVIAGRDVKLREHGAGLCLGGGSKADFVAAKYLCAKWSASKAAPAVDRFGGGVDDLPEELADKLGDHDDAAPPGAILGLDGRPAALSVTPEPGPPAPAAPPEVAQVAERTEPEAAATTPDPPAGVLN